MTDSADGRDPLYDVGDGGIAVKQRHPRIPVSLHCHLRLRGASRRQTKSSYWSDWRNASVNGCDLDGWHTRVPRRKVVRSCAPGEGDVLGRCALGTLMLAGVRVDGADANKRDSMTRFG